MDDAVWLGVDMGTQSVRVVAVDGTGVVHGQGIRQLTSVRRAERHEQDPGEWWTNFAEAAHEALAGLEPSRVSGLAVDSTSGTIMLADADGTPLTAGLMYDDARAAAQTERVNDVGAGVWEMLGYQRMQTSWALPKLLWLRENGYVSSRSAKLLHQADFLTWRLAGRQLPADSSHALKTGYHLIDERWPVEVFESLDIPPQVLPEVAESGTVLGTVCADAAAQTGIPSGTPIVAGMTDGCAAQLGAGPLEIGGWNSVLGTTLVLKGTSRDPVRDPRGIVYSHRGPDKTWLPGGASNSGAGALTRRFPEADLDALTASAAERRPALVAYPLTSERGERFPILAPDLDAFVLGRCTDEVDLFQALLVGTACVERLSFDYLDLLGAPVHGRLTLTGGGARNRYWSRMRATMLGRPVYVPSRSGSPLGMAILAATSHGTPVGETGARMAPVVEVVEPGGDAAGLLDQYARFLDHLEAVGHLDTDIAAHVRRAL